MEKTYNITIDGPAGSGKSTIAKAVAETLGIAYVDTGAMYRAIAYYVSTQEVDPNDVGKVVELLDKIKIEVKFNAGTQKTYLNGKVCGEELRQEKISNMASMVSKIPAVRLKMADLQRAIARANSCIMDGRDMGSYVLPDAEFKFYLTADVDTRARRRWLQLDKTDKKSLEKIKADLIERDERDMSRDIAPLCIPKNSYVIDTSNLTPDDVLKIILDEVKRG